MASILGTRGHNDMDCEILAPEPRDFHDGGGQRRLELVQIVIIFAL